MSQSTIPTTSVHSFSIAEYTQKIDQIEEMLEELKKGLAHFQQAQKSIEKGESDIKSGNITTCKNEQELDSFFDSL